MDNPTCIIPECDKPVRSRGYCATCYNRARKAGTLPLVRTHPRHSLRDVDLEAKTATCSVCGPTTLRVRKLRYQCEVVFQRSSAYKRPPGVKPRAGNTYPEPLTGQDYRLRREYGISLAEYEQMREDQEGRCLICGTKPHRLVVDHCHDAGHVRGLLCTQCNIGLGMFKDNPSFLTSAADYLRA